MKIGEMKTANSFDARLEDENGNLEKLIEVKRKRERNRKEDERFHLRGEIDNLEAEERELLETLATRQTGEGILLSRDQLEREFEQLRDELAYSKSQLAGAEQREKNFKEQLGIVKRSLRDKDAVKKDLEISRESETRLKELADALALENTRLREELEDRSKLLDRERRENSFLRLQNTDSDELERDFQLQKQLLVNVLEGEVLKANRAAAEAKDIAEAKDTAEANEDSIRDEVVQLERLLRKKEAVLENEVMEKWKIHAEKEEQRRAFEEKETELRNRVEELLNALADRQVTASEAAESARNAELRAETERLVEQHYEALIGRDLEHTLEVERLQDDWKTRLEELEDKLRRANADNDEQLSKALTDKKETSEELDRKSHECAGLKRDLENCREELEKARLKAAPLLDEDKIGKLERALVRLKLENDQLRSTKSEKGTQELLREKESHIIDLQSEVSALREALKRRPVEESAEIRRTAAEDRVTRESYDEMLVAHRRLLEETSRLRAALDGAGGNGDPPSALVELFKAKQKLNASGARISQLEKWLDEIFNTDLNINGGLGPMKPKGSNTYRSGVVLPELKTQTRLGIVNKLSKPKTK